MKPYFVYILKCKDSSFYAGITNNLEKRISDHNNGKGSKYVFSRRPAVLIYKEVLKNRSEALKIEAEIKSMSRSQKIILIRDKK